jgi:aminomethyltransferase
MNQNLTIKKTPLWEEHKKLGARMFSFAGWEMPLQYSSVKEEHFVVRNSVGIFDVSHMGQVFVSGKDSVSFLQSLVPQDVSTVAEGKASYSFLVNEDGGIIDDLIMYRLPDEEEEKNRFLLIVNASRIKNDLEWLFNQKKLFNVKLENESDNLSMIAVQGPFACELIKEAGIKKEFQPLRFSINETKLFNTKVLLARTGYTGEDGFEIIVKNEEILKLWTALLEIGQKFNIKPVGYAARDILRLEASLLLYGQDMDETTTPIEASLCWAVCMNKKDDYKGKERILTQMLSKKVNKKLVGFKMLDNSIPRNNYEIYIENENVGKVTSGGISPYINAGIGLGYVDTKKYFEEGAKIDIMIRGKLHPAEIVKRPFYGKNRR